MLPVLRPRILTGGERSRAATLELVSDIGGRKLPEELVQRGGRRARGGRVVIAYLYEKVPPIVKKTL